MPDVPILSDKQWAAIDLLADGQSKAKTADIIGVSPQTIYNWLKDEVFVDHLTQAVLDTESARRVERIQRAKKLANTALEEIESRLNSEKKREAISVKDLVSIYEKTIATAAKENELVKPGDRAKDPDDGQETPTLGVSQEHLQDSEFRKGLLKLMRKKN